MFSLTVKMTENFNKMASKALNEASSRKQSCSLGKLESKLKEINEKLNKYSAPSNGDEKLKRLLDERDNLQKDIAKIMQTQKEYGGPEGPEPTRYGDWEKKGIVSDF